MREIKSEKVWIENYTFGNMDKDRAVHTMANELGISVIDEDALYKMLKNE